jgi:hypothetical protein
MKARRWLQVAMVLLIASGCAQRADWIQGTLVTVDATGRWTGSWSGPSAGGTSSGQFQMTLRQTGAKAAGEVGLTGPFGAAARWNGPIDATVNGDVLKFARRDGQLSGEVIVAGDEMSGTVTFGDGTRTLRLQRQP